MEIFEMCKYSLCVKNHAACSILLFQYDDIYSTMHTAYASCGKKSAWNVGT